MTQHDRPHRGGSADAPRDAREAATEADDAPQRISRRRMVGYLLAAPTLVAAARFVDAEPAAAEGIPAPNVADLFDLSDVLNAAVKCYLFLR